MKQKYISLMLSIVVLFLSAGILYVYGQQETYKGPTCAFGDTRPECGVWKPVDTKPYTSGDVYTGNQEKLATLNLNKLNFSSSNDPYPIEVSDGGKIIPQTRNAYIWLNSGSATGATIFQNSFNAANFLTKGLVLPTSYPGTGGTNGMIYYDGSKVKLCNKANCSALTDWTDIGTGGGDSLWKKEDGGAYYDGGNVRVSGGAPGYYYIGDRVVVAEKKNISLINTVKADNVLACPDTAIMCEGGGSGGGGSGGGFDYGTKLSCDDDATTRDCGTYAAGTGSEGARGYDEYISNGVRKRALYVYKTNPPSTVTAGTFVGKLKATGFDFSAAKSEVIEFIGEGQCRTLPSGARGLVTSFTVNTGGGPGEATEFYVIDSFSAAGTYTYFARNGDVTVGNEPIKVCTRPDLPWEDMKNYIDKITVVYIPFD